MSASATPSDYLVISRGQWDESATPEQIQNAIDDFYAWLEGQIGEGKNETRAAPLASRQDRRA